MTQWNLRHLLALLVAFYHNFDSKMTTFAATSAFITNTASLTIANTSSGLSVLTVLNLLIFGSPSHTLFILIAAGSNLISFSEIAFIRSAYTAAPGS